MAPNFRPRSVKGADNTGSGSQSDLVRVAWAEIVILVVWVWIAGGITFDSRGRQICYALPYAKVDILFYLVCVCWWAPFHVVWSSVGLQSAYCNLSDISSRHFIVFLDSASRQLEQAGLLPWSSHGWEKWTEQEAILVMFWSLGGIVQVFREYSGMFRCHLSRDFELFYSKVPGTK